MQDKIISPYGRGSLTSDFSLCLKDIISDFSEFPTEDMEKVLSETKIWGIDSNEFQALSQLNNGRHVFICKGMFVLIKFITYIVKISDFLLKTRESEFIIIDNDEVSEALAFLCAGYSLTINAIIYKDISLIFNIPNVLDDATDFDAQIGYKGAIMFLVFHEIAHLTNEDYIFDGRKTTDNRIKELYADKTAFFSARSELRDYFFSSYMFFMLGFAFAEVFGARRIDTHPLWIERIHNLAEMLEFPNDLEAKEIARDFLTRTEQHLNKLIKANISGSKISSDITLFSMKKELAAKIIETIAEKTRVRQ